MRPVVHIRENPSLQSKVEQLPGPILVLGAGGFVGANLWKTLSESRSDVWGTVSPKGTWRLDPHPHIRALDVECPGTLENWIATLRPKTIFNCLCYGGYPHQREARRLFAVNAEVPTRILEWIRANALDTTFVQAGSASDLGEALDSPSSDTSAQPHSLYGVSKHSASQSIRYFGGCGIRCANLRFYSLYGPMEEPSRLIPRLIDRGAKKTYPPLADSKISHDFVFVEDACEAMVDCALNLKSEHWGESFNVASGQGTTLEQLARWAQNRFEISQTPTFGTFPPRPWDSESWVGDASGTTRHLGWSPRHRLETGLEKTIGFQSPNPTQRRRTLSVVVACFGDAEALPELCERIQTAFERSDVLGQILFVDDGSQDDTTDVIRRLSESSSNVRGVRHSTNFGSQQAFRSGMELATGDACVLLDGDLQDPPELIESFVREWKDGCDVVYGVRQSRDEPWGFRLGRHLFYRVLRWGSDISIPADVGDFGLMDRRVVHEILRHGETQTLLRGLRTRVGFRQKGVGYDRPRRPYGKSTYSLGRYLEYFKTACFAFGSRFSRHYVYLSGFISVGLFIGSVLSPTVFQGIVLAVLGFLVGSSGLLVEYLQRIANELRRRPPFIRSEEIRNGEIVPWTDHRA